MVKEQLYVDIILDKLQKALFSKNGIVLIKARSVSKSKYYVN